MTLVSIDVTPDIAQKIRFMADSGVFGIRDGSVTLYFKNSHLTTTKTELFTYQQQHALDIKQESPILTMLA